MKRTSAVLLVAVITASFGMNAILQNTTYTETVSLTIPPGEYYYIPFYIVGEGRLSGDFFETQSQLVSFYFFTQQQYDHYQSTGIPTSLFSTSNTAQATYETAISAPGTYYIVTAHGIGYDQTQEQVTLHVKIDGTNLPYFGLEILTLPAIGVLAISYLVWRRDNRRKILSLLKANPNYGFGGGEDDDQILKITKELCHDLRFRFNPTTVYYIVWLKFAGVRLAPPDLCLIGLKGSRRGWLHLASALRGRLSPNEWRPLIASSLIYTFNPTLRLKRRLTNLIVPLAIVAIVAIDFLLYRLFYGEFTMAHSVTERFLLLQFPLLLLPMGFLVLFAARKGNMIYRKFFLQADDIATKVVGKEPLIQTLTKIDSMSLPDVEERKKDKPTIWRRVGILPWPSITQRIQRIQKWKDR